MRFILLRHGETLWNIEQRLQGHENSELSDRGREQALRFAKYASAFQPALVVASDLGRTKETARLLGYEDVVCDKRFRELNMGEWTGRSKPELIANHTDDYNAWRAGQYTPRNGEAWAGFCSRVAQGVRHWLSQAEGDVLAVVHSGVIRAAFSEFLGIPPARIIPTTPGAAAVLNFENRAGLEAKLEGYNIGAVAPDETVSD
ncbi:histidine phosphatase family protein [Aureimonas fodinaquatilis]|uniref:Histidine phosphatase family protein n=1 Tax=Aureimonas fodinaquatilis TaxID=2565783 RepID=A0A5B0E139_9HYPH|nr:histidine phosphatase family protein [Aureimonas fodinaquatilis]KAA0971845.1 histidine phosphatase family protein [Aureimonas fodinaquatilis]